MKILGTGISGLIGSRIVELLKDFEFENISRQNGVDIALRDQIFSAIENSSAEVVLHLAAFTQVDEAEMQKNLGENSLAWKINVLGTRNVTEACEKYNKKLIYFSTDMVFPGTKDLPDKYQEEDKTGALGFYAKTKEEAEKIVEKASCSWLILRIAYPYRASFEKKDYVRLFKELLESKKQLSAVSDHYFTPTFIDDISTVLRHAIDDGLTGKFHIVGNETISPFIAAKKVARVFGLDDSLIEETNREIYFRDKAPRAYNLSLNNDKIEKLGIKMSSFEEGLEKIKAQLKD
jgi:dTDP-4-dehydrorhamnose reductase